MFLKAMGISSLLRIREAVKSRLGKTNIFLKGQSEFENAQGQDSSAWNEHWLLQAMR